MLFVTNVTYRKFISITTEWHVVSESIRRHTRITRMYQSARKFLKLEQNNKYMIGSAMLYKSMISSITVGLILY